MRGDIEGLRDRYVAGDQSLTDDEIEHIRHQTNSQAWADMVEVRASKTKITRIAPGETDAQRADAFRSRMLDALSPVIDILDEAKRHNIRVGFQLSPADAFGRHHVQMLEILKEL